MTSTTPRTHARNAALLLSAALLLAACGGSNDREPVTPPTTPGGTVTPPVSTDSFFQIVLARVSSLLDNDEPVPVENITVTVPENTEPEPVPSN